MFFLLIFTFAITIIIIIFRIRKVMQGTKVSAKKTIAFSAYFLAIASFLVYNSFLIGSVPFVYAVPYSVVVIIAGYGSYRYSKRILSFWVLPNSDGGHTIYSKGGLAIYLLYVAALIVRSVINFLFIGSEKLYFINQETLLKEYNATLIMPLVQTDATTIIFAFAATDLLLMIGVGLVLGRNARVLQYYYKEKKRIKS